MPRSDALCSTLSLALVSWIFALAGPDPAAAGGTDLGSYDDPVAATRLAASPDGVLLAVVTTFDAMAGFASHVVFSSDLGATWSPVGGAFPPSWSVDPALTWLDGHFYVLTVGEREDGRPTLRRFDAATGAPDSGFGGPGDAVRELDLPNSLIPIPDHLVEVEIAVVPDGTLEVLGLWNVGHLTYWRSTPEAPSNPVLREVENLAVMPEIESGLALEAPTSLVPGLYSGIGEDGRLVLVSLHRDILDGSIAAAEREVPGLSTGRDGRTSLVGSTEASADRAAFAVEACVAETCWIQTRWTADYFLPSGVDPDWSFVSPSAPIPSAWGTVAEIEGGFLEVVLALDDGTGHEFWLRRFDWDGRPRGPVVRAPAPAETARFEVHVLDEELVAMTGLDGELGADETGAVFRLFDLGFFSDGFESGDTSAWMPASRAGSGTRGR